MRLEETDLSDKIVESVQSSGEYKRILEAVRNDYKQASVSEVKGYDSQDESVDYTLVFPFDGIEDCSFGSAAFGIEDKEVTKASATLHFKNTEDENQSRIRDYRYLHEGEEFYRPEEDMILENDHYETIEIIEYYQDNRE